MKKLKKNKKLATFIIEKWVTKDKISWPRDMKIAYAAIELYPEKEFWEQLPKKIEATSMIIFASEKAKYALKMQYEEWKQKELVKKNYQPEEFKKFELEITEIKVDNTPKKPRNALDFCR